MAPLSRGVERVANVLVSNSFSGHICRSCRQAMSRRTYAAAAAAQAVETPDFSHPEPSIPATSKATEPDFKVLAGVLLSRPPLITPEPHPFETAYHLYQRRLNERLVLPFTQYFYYKRGTPAFEQWRTKRKERGGAATRDVGKYNAYGDEGWNDEVLMGDTTGTPQDLVEKLVDEEGRATEFVGETGDLKTAGLKRITDADQNNDQRSLERSLSRTLYLLVMNKRGKGQQQNWVFPSGLVEGKESLREAAQRVLSQSCGVNMNTWFVANHPVGHYVAPSNSTADGAAGEKQKQGESNTMSQKNEVGFWNGDKTFFMKARIMAGQADLKSAEKKYDDFKWLSKDEVEKHVHPRYWLKIRNMLVDQ